MCLIAVTVSIGIIWYYHIPLTVTVTGPFGDQFTEFLAGGNIIMCDILICVLTIVFCFWFMSKFSKRSVLDRIYSNRVWLKELKNEIIKVALDIETLKKNQISVESEEASLGSIKKRYAEVEQYLNKLVCQRDEMNACKVKSLFDYWFGPKLNLRITAMLSKIW